MSGATAVAIVGPTAAGKSEIALVLAAAVGGEIVSADSRQVYRYLDIGTAKPSPTERARVPHHLLDVVDPDGAFDAASYRDLARAAVEAIHARSRPVIICGGTGLYLRALLRGLFRGPARSAAVRARLRAREECDGPGTLHRLLARADPTAADRLHPHDLLRVVRALEVLELTGRPISAWQAEHGFGDRVVRALVLGCARPREELAARIEARCQAMLAAGLLDEIRDLWARGYSPELPPLRSVGYREMGTYLRGECDRTSAFDAFARATRRLAKRQRTWFRAEPAIEWFHPDRDRPALLARAIAWLEQPWPLRTSISRPISPG
jgi:tRNA dimethylallyltransferase